MLVVDDPRHLRDLERQPKMDQESWDTALPHQLSPEAQKQQHRRRQLPGTQSGHPLKSQHIV